MSRATRNNFVCQIASKTSGVKIGEIFGRLTVIGEPFYLPCRGTKRQPSPRLSWAVCRCVCGNIGAYPANCIRSGNTKSCGCLFRETVPENNKTHGLNSISSPNQRLYRIWKNIQGRCYSPKHISYGMYGARGVGMCDEWRFDPVEFVRWARASGYKSDLVCDRINPELGYSPENCQWITGSENSKKVVADRNKKIIALKDRIASLEGVVWRLMSRNDQLEARMATLIECWE